MRKIYILIMLPIIFSIALSIWMVSNAKNKQINMRPKHCDENGCMSEEVFQNLPEFPKDFYDKWVLVYLGRLSNLDLMEEEYWRQPEFYASNFDEQGRQYYTVWEPGKKVLYFSAGSGPYPADVVIENLTQGETINVTTFWHASWAIAKYQAFSLAVEYPENMKVRMAQITVNQTPHMVEKCFDIRFEPEVILLEPTYPLFYYNWTAKVNAFITVKECPTGQYGFQVIPKDPPPSDLEALEFKYGSQLSSIRAGGAWQIFLSVN